MSHIVGLRRFKDIDRASHVDLRAQTQDWRDKKVPVKQPDEWHA